MRLYYQIQRINFARVRRPNGERKRRASRRPSCYLLRVLYLFHLQSPCGIKFWAKWLPSSSFFAPFKRFQNIRIAISRKRSLKQYLKPTLPVESFGREAGQCERERLLIFHFYKLSHWLLRVCIFIRRRMLRERAKNTFAVLLVCSLAVVNVLTCYVCMCVAVASIGIRTEEEWED